MDWTYNQVAKMIDHSLLRPELDVKAVVEGCGLANELGVMSVCVRPCDVVLAANILADSEVLVTTVVGFPHGARQKRPSSMRRARLSSRGHGSWTWFSI